MKKNFSRRVMVKTNVFRYKLGNILYHLMIALFCVLLISSIYSSLFLPKLKNSNKRYEESLSLEIDVVSPAPKLSQGNILPLATYFPAFHACPLNDRIWGKGWTEWNNVNRSIVNYKNSEPLIKPSRTIGYYNLLDKEVRQKQGDFARLAGLYGIVAHHYWFYDRAEFDGVIQLMKEDGEPSVPFCLCWANEGWTKRWDGSKDVLVAQRYDKEMWKAHFDYLMQYFMLPRYIRVRGAPVLFIYRLEIIPSDVAEEMFDSFRKWAIDEGFTGIHVVQFRNMHNFLTPQNDVADAIADYLPHSWGPREDYIAEAHGRDSSVYYRGVYAAWDNTPRYLGGAFMPPTNHPYLFEKSVREVAKIINQNPNIGTPNFMMVNSFNEWGEGMCLEPSSLFGTSYLTAIHNGLDLPKPTIPRTCFAIIVQSNIIGDHKASKLIQQRLVTTLINLYNLSNNNKNMVRIVIGVPNEYAKLFVKRIMEANSMKPSQSFGPTFVDYSVMFELTGIEFPSLVLDTIVWSRKCHIPDDALSKWFVPVEPGNIYQIKSLTNMFSSINPEYDIITLSTNPWDDRNFGCSSDVCSCMYHEAPTSLFQSLMNRRYSDGSCGLSFINLGRFEAERRRFWPAGTFSSGQSLSLRVAAACKVHNKLIQSGWKEYIVQPKLGQFRNSIDMVKCQKDGIYVSVQHFGTDFCLQNYTSVKKSLSNYKGLFRGGIKCVPLLNVDLLNMLHQRWIPSIDPKPIRVAFAKIAEFCGVKLDTDHYLQTHVDVKRAGLDANRHFEEAGIYEGRKFKFSKMYELFNQVQTVLEPLCSFFLYISGRNTVPTEFIKPSIADVTTKSLENLIVIIFHDIGATGAVLVALRLVKILLNLSYEVIVLTPNDLAFDLINERKMLASLGAKFVAGDPVALITRYVHARSIICLTVLTAPLARYLRGIGYKGQIILYIHEAGQPFYSLARSIRKGAWESADAIVTPSPVIQATYSNCGKMYKSRSIIVPNSIDPIYFKVQKQHFNRIKSIEIGSLKINTNDLLVIGIGSSATGKNFNSLYEVCTSLAQYERPNKGKLYCVHVGVRESSFLYSPNTMILQAIENEELIKLLDYSDVHIMLSVAESYGLVIQEAASRRVPTISTPNAGAIVQGLKHSKGMLLSEATLSNITSLKLELTAVLKSLIRDEFPLNRWKEHAFKASVKYHQIAKKEQSRIWSSLLKNEKEVNQMSCIAINVLDIYTASHLFGVVDELLPQYRDVERIFLLLNKCGNWLNEPIVQFDFRFERICGSNDDTIKRIQSKCKVVRAQVGKHKMHEKLKDSNVDEPDHAKIQKRSWFSDLSYELAKTFAIPDRKLLSVNNKDSWHSGFGDPSSIKGARCFK